MAGIEALEVRLRTIHEALAPGGLLLFDVAAPGRSGPAKTRHVFWARKDACLGLEEREDPDGGLTRSVTVFAREGELYRRVEEGHVLRLYVPEAVEELLGRTGFRWERLPGYGGLPSPAGWHVFAATKG